ncbi:hypothetical protein COOONC_17527 [Cooperia oncophora]
MKAESPNFFVSLEQPWKFLPSKARVNQLLLQCYLAVFAKKALSLFVHLTPFQAMSFDLESCELSSSSCSIDDKLPSTNNLIRGKEGQYAVGRKLAQGRYGAVYEVLRKSDGRPFACKLEICGANSHGLDMDYVVMSQAAKRGFFCFSYLQG